ncbi:MAG: C-type lectin domain-containing protein [Myxococcota bacterium]
MRHALLSSVLLLLALAACPEDATVETSCGGTTCADNERCVAGACRTSCEVDEDCPLPQICEGQVCLAPEEGSASGSSSGGASSSGFVSSSGGAAVSSSSSSAQAVSSSSSAAVSSSAGSASSSSAASSSSSSSSVSSSSGGVPDAGTPDAGDPCVAQAGNCFTGVQQPDGTCQFTYKCGPNDACVAPDDTCMPYNTAYCLRRILGTRVFIGCNIAANWPQAVNNCRTLPGFELASIRNAEEQALVADFVVDDSVWIGASDTTTEGTFTWVDGFPLTYGATGFTYPWCNGEPNDSGTEDCGEFKNENSCWNDDSCGNTQPFLCAR